MITLSPTGVPDMAADLLAAIASARGNRLVLTTGVYPTSQPLILPNNLILDCEPNTIIRAVAPMDTMLTMELRDYSIQQLCIRNLTLDGNKKAQTCASFSKLSMSHFTAIDGLLVKNAVGDGLRLLMCQGGVFQSIKALSNGGVGIQLLGCNAAKCYAMTSILNTGTGVVIDKYIDGTALYTGGLSIYGLHSENNAAHGLEIGNIPEGDVRIDGGWFEGNGGDGIRVGAVGAFISGLSISRSGTGDRYAVRVLPAARGCVIQNNWIAPAPGVYGRVAIEAGAQYIAATPNYNRHTGEPIDVVLI